jgi:propanol-preferring alcohol dehydrogenase
MKAAVMTAPGQPLEIRDLAIPKPGSGQVLVKIDVCGLCHTDLHFWKGDHPMPRDFPATLGHEGIGRVVELGEGVSRLQKGDRVGVGYVYGTCGDCRECLTGHETHCANVACTGVHAEGCFAEYAVLREDWATRIPDGLDIVEAAPLLCAGVAAYSAVRKAALEPGELAVVFGAGGLGSYAIQVAKNYGARVAVVDVADGKLEHAGRVGADHLIRAGTDTVAQIRALGGADASFNFAPVAASWRQMIESAGARARLVLISLPTEALAFDAAEIIESGLKVMGSADGTRQELRQLMGLAEARQVRSVVETVPFRDINGAFQRLASGEVQGRLVIDLRAI